MGLYYHSGKDWVGEALHYLRYLNMMDIKPIFPVDYPLKDPGLFYRAQHKVARDGDDDDLDNDENDDDDATYGDDGDEAPTMMNMEEMRS